jgi:hypothetical protein
MLGLKLRTEKGAERCFAHVLRPDGRVRECSQMAVRPYHVAMEMGDGCEEERVMEVVRQERLCFCTSHHQDVQVLMMRVRGLKEQIEKAPCDVRLLESMVSVRRFLQDHFFHFVHRGDGHRGQLVHLERRLLSLSPFRRGDRVWVVVQVGRVRVGLTEWRG